MTRDDITPALLDRYLAGECTPEEVPFVHACLDADSSVQVLLGQMRQVRQAAALGGTWEVHGLWRRIKQGLENDMASEALSAIRPLSVPAAGQSVMSSRSHLVSLGGGMSVHEGSARPALKRIGVSGTRTLRRGVWSAAAVLLSVLLMIASWNTGVRHISQHTAASMMMYATGNGERATIVLPDGGTVALNVASRLEVPMDYMSGHRTVQLVGDGLFTVSHHAGAPLTVIAGGTAARVLGTHFVVRRYGTDTATVVAVQDGKVAVGATVVTANQVAEIGQTGVPHLGRSDGSLFTFATGTLTVNGLPLPAAIVELDRWYDADIRLGDSALARVSLHGTFGFGSLGDLTEVLEATLDVHVVREGRVMTLFSKR